LVRGRAVPRPLAAAAKAVGEMSVSPVHALADYTSLDSSKDPLLSAELLQQIGREIGKSLLGADCHC
jgi:hypothetical protein